VYAATEPAGVLAHLLADDGPDTAEAERTLGLCLEEYHWAVVLWSESSRVAQVEDLIRFALTVARTVGGAQPLIVVSRTSEVWMWTRWPKPPVPQALDAACARLALPAGIGVSAGPVRAGAAGFRRSLLAARAGRHEVGGRAGRRWHDFEGVSAMPFLATDDEQSRWFVVEVLGELGYDDPRFVTLRETLRLYLARGRSRQQVAAEMFINRNTVAYRVQQALKLLGRSIDEDAFDVRLALEIARATAARATARRPVDH
jgi:DNA-binding PucR family transcriptional regulator